MTTEKSENGVESCPAESLLRTLSGKWKPQMFRLAMEGPLRFNSLMRQLPGSNKQSVSTALRELEEAGLLVRTVVREKPLHVEYVLSEKGRGLLDVFLQVEQLTINS